MPHHARPPLPCPAVTFTVVGFMGTGRVAFNAALSAVFIEGESQHSRKTEVVRGMAE